MLRFSTAKEGALCHTGALFSDQKFHAVPVLPLGFGKNGFGVDYGRFNASHAPADLYKFRTPILYNVTKTAPYGHAGSMRTLRQAIVSHVDPLSLVDLNEMDRSDATNSVKRWRLATCLAWPSLSMRRKWMHQSLSKTLNLK